MHKKHKSVAITGIGPVTAIGIGREEFNTALRENECGLDGVTSFDTTPYACKNAAEVRDFDVEEFLESQKTYLDRTAEFALAATSLALESADLDLGSVRKDLVGLSVGTAFGCLATMQLFFSDFVKKGARLVKPFLFPHTYSNTAASLLAIEYGLTGYHANFAGSSAQAIAYGVDLIRSGKATVVLAGGYESLNETLFAGHDQSGLLARGDDISTCRPFSDGSEGFLLGEGGCMIVLEDVEHAKKRGAPCLAELSDVAMAGSAELIVPETDGVDCVVAAANGSRQQDAAEAAMIRRVADGVPIYSVKGLIGETLGAAGALQIASAAALLELGYVPPSPGLGGDITEERELDMQRILANSVDRAGNVISFTIDRPS